MQPVIFQSDGRLFRRDHEFALLPEEMKAKAVRRHFEGVFVTFRARACSAPAARANEACAREKDGFLGMRFGLTASSLWKVAG